ncbi:MAG: biotin-dependent carboxyltransferase family protein [Ekhidna sp.]
MGKLEVIKTGPLATIQDKGRFGFRRYGIPQSGAMDWESMQRANSLVRNDLKYPVVEFALMGLTLKAFEPSVIGVVGASCKLNGVLQQKETLALKAGDVVEISPPNKVYAYVGIKGLLEANKEFNSYSTYLMAGFGGHEGRALQKGDTLVSNVQKEFSTDGVEITNGGSSIRFTRGPEWAFLNTPLNKQTFSVDPSSNRMGIRLNGQPLKCSISEISSSAVIPGTIQLPASGQPIILMNDCQTTGGYPRIGNVLTEDLGKLAQIKPGQNLSLHEIE